MHLDPLESRTHFSSTTVVRTGNILTITGTDHSDEISIAAGKTKFSVLVNDQQSIFRNRGVKLIRIFGLAGNDTIVGGPSLKIPCSIDGGRGNDEIYGSAAPDSILGRIGEDTISGMGGGDYIDGGAGNDSFYGNEIITDTTDYRPIDVVHGGAGHDVARNFGYYFSTGIETNDVDHQIGSVISSHGKTQLQFSYPIGTFDVLTVGSLVQTSPGVYSVDIRIDADIDSTNPVKNTKSIDITAAKGAKILINYLYLFWGIDGAFIMFKRTFPFVMSL